MVRRTILGGLLFLSILAAAFSGSAGKAQAAGIGQPYDWGRFYYYPYVYYPHNYSAPVQYDNLLGPRFVNIDTTLAKEFP